jgi:hypothetical protein
MLSGEPSRFPGTEREQITPRTAWAAGLKRLYHYEKFNPNYLADVLTKQRAHCSDPANLNVPWDCMPWFDGEARDDPMSVTNFRAAGMRDILLNSQYDDEREEEGRFEMRTLERQTEPAAIMKAIAECKASMDTDIERIRTAQLTVKQARASLRGNRARLQDLEADLQKAERKGAMAKS